MTADEVAHDWERITDFVPRGEADAKLATWRNDRHAEGVEIRDQDVRLDIGRGSDGSTVYRYSYRRPGRQTQD